MSQLNQDVFRVLLYISVGFRTAGRENCDKHPIVSFSLIAGSTYIFMHFPIFLQHKSFFRLDGMVWYGMVYFRIKHKHFTGPDGPETSTTAIKNLSLACYVHKLNCYLQTLNLD